MQAAWRLAINSLVGSRLRTALLTAAIALSTGLIVAITCGVASLNAALTDRVAKTVGTADARLTRVADAAFSRDLLDLVLGWQGVRTALPHAIGPITLSSGGIESLALATGVDLETEFAERPLSLLRGRAPTSSTEIAIEERLAEELSLDIGDTVGVVSFYGGPPELSVVGIIKKNPFWAFSRPGATLALEPLGEILGEPNSVRSIDLIFDLKTNPFAFVALHAAELDDGMILQLTERMTSGVTQNLRSQRIGLTVIAIIGFMAAGFIILTGLATNVLQRQRELAIIRCLGGSRALVAGAQIISGLMLGGFGAILGTPFGIAVAYIGVLFFHEHLQTGLVIPQIPVSLVAVASLLTGAAGAVWPALLAARVSPLEALTIRAKKPGPYGVFIALAIGLTLILTELVLLMSARTGAEAFWRYLLGGIEGMFIGYFLLGAPVLLFLSRFIGPLAAWLTRTPAPIVRGAIRSAPFRYGMTAASLMVGLAMMIVIWTAGGAVVTQWIGRINFPDAFVNGWLGLTTTDRDRIAALPFVTDTNAVSIIDIDASDTFGVTGVQNIGSSFVAIEPEAFFRMNTFLWIEGDPETAKRRLLEGDAVLVAQEFHVARGLGVGDTFHVRVDQRDIPFEIVGVITSPGLEIVSRYYDVGKLYRSQALSAVFGVRNDLLKYFAVDSIQLVQIQLSDTISDEEAVRQLRRLFAGGSLSVGSGREIKRSIAFIANGSFLVISTVAVAAILIACLGVGNVIIAGIETRKFEFGVLRAIGAEGRLLGRLVLTEALLLSLAAGLLGTALGLQAAWSELHLYRKLAGLDLTLQPPLIPILAGWMILCFLTLAAALPPAWRLARRTPRDLLTGLV